MLIVTSVALIGALSTHVDSAPIAGKAASSVALMRVINIQLASADRSHSGRGFPESMPPLSPELSAGERRLAHYYKFDYTPVRRTANGPVVDYLLRAVPYRPVCGCMSFVTSSDGRFHFSMEHAVATLSDPSMGASGQ